MAINYITHVCIADRCSVDGFARKLKSSAHTFWYSVNYDDSKW